MSAVPEVLVVGEALVDVVEEVDGRRTDRPGGSPANVAVGLHRLGRRVQLLTALGSDGHGDLLRHHLTGVDVVAAPADRTATALARLDARGSAAYAFDIVWDLRGSRPHVLPGWVHVGSLAAFLRPGGEDVLALAEEACSAGSAVSFDPNCRPDIATRDVDRVEELVSLSTVVKLSDEDLAWLYPGAAFADVAGSWLARRPEVVVLTRGAEGAVAWTAAGKVDIGPAEGGAVVDTVGAGDAFMAGLVDALIGQRPIGDALASATRIARRTCERAGADPPYAKDLL